jgi:hypothetical protein
MRKKKKYVNNTQYKERMKKQDKEKDGTNVKKEER